jgi:selenocysteine lyase/cysteine desulfurase
VLDLSRPDQIALGANTHEFVARILSCFDADRPLRVLTTDGEFYSFARQVARIEELPRVTVTRVPVEPFASFETRWAEAAARTPCDLAYVSQVFFGSGFAADVEALVRAIPRIETVVVIDGYHGLCAVPTSLRAVEDRAFYVGGGYKYAQSGEGIAYLHVPAGCRLRPVNTGWFSRFGALTKAPDAGVEYPDDGFRFWGATFEPTGAYRLNAAMELLDRLGLDVAAIHRHVAALQERFLAGLEGAPGGRLPVTALVTARDLACQGNFLVFRFPGAPELFEALRARQVETDLRGDRIRFGFGIYHDPEDVDQLLHRLATL